MDKPFDFSWLLNPMEQASLGDPEKWRWISSLGIKPSQPSISHAAHERWMKKAGNTHRPGHREVMLTLRGSAVYSIAGKCYFRTPGTVILLNEREERDLKGSLSKKGFGCLWLRLFHREYLTYFVNFCDALGRYTHTLPMQVKSGNTSRLILDAWDQCRAEPDNPLAMALLKSLLSSTMLEILGSPLTTSAKGQHERVVDSVKDYVVEHLNEDLSLRNLAAFAGYSEFFFHRMFLRHTGKTPVQYVNGARLAHAVKLLDDGYKVEAVAEAVGFSSVSYFHHFFRKNLGQTPGQLRTRKRSAGPRP